jgi:hypothetical protein
MACRTPDQIQNEPVDPSEIHGKRVAMVAWGTAPDDVVAFTGIGSWNGSTLTMRRDGGETFEIPSDWLRRITRVTPQLRDILGESEFYFSVTVGDVSDAGAAGLLKTSLNWPK